MEFAFPLLRETAVIGSGLMTPASASARPAGVIFMPKYVRISRCARSFTRGIREYSFFWRRSNSSV
jgi:hypothetical protein